MANRSRITAAALLAVGIGLGYAASSGRMTLSTATAAEPTTEGRVSGPSDADRAAVAAHNREVQIKAEETGKQPNICIIWGDDVGRSNISAYTNGLMGYRTPNIDRVAKEGMIFTDYYAEQSCTAGRASFITGQHGMRTGLTKVGLPGAKVGLQKEDPTIAQLLKAQGYATAQIGKNHLGDRNEYLPTVHGFDEFYGNLYHLNAEEEPELPDYPKDPAFRAKYGPRGVLDSKATDEVDDTVDPRFGKVGKQVIKDTGPLTKKRMETIDDDIADRSADFIKRQAEAGKPFFLWVNFTHMHFRTHPKPESVGQSGRWMSEYADTMIDHDKNVGTVLKALDDAGVADNTFVMYSTDNGPHMNTWPDGAMTPFRNEKNSNWEGAYRVPAMVRWPGKIKPGSVANGIVSHLDWMPTLLAMAGDAGRDGEVAQRLRGRRHDLQSPPRRVQPGPVPDRRCGKVPAGVVPLLQRRPAVDRPPVRQLEDRVYGTASSGHLANLGRAVRQPAGAEDFQPPA